MRIDSDGNAGIGLTPTANMSGLSIEKGVITLKEVVGEPTADTNYGKIYTKSDNKLYFQDGGGSEHELSESSGIANIVEDSTPELGGDLQSNGSDIIFADNDKAIFGTDSDASIYFDNSNTGLTEAMRIKSGKQVGIGIDPLADLHIARDGTGKIRLQQLDPSNEIYWNFGFTGGNKNLVLSPSTGASFIISNYDGSYALNITNSSSIFNQNGVDRDFRVESQNKEYMFFVNAGTDKVGIGLQGPNGTLHIMTSDATGTADTNSTLVLEKNDDTILSFLSKNDKDQYINFGDPEDNNIGYLRYDHGTDYMAFGVNASESMRIDSSQNVGIGITPTANMSGLSIEKGVITLKEVPFVPTADTNYGKIYTKSDNKLYFQDGGGSEHELGHADATGISNVVEDSTPELGGDLQSNGSDIIFADNDKAIFGTDSDASIE
jgi:uncharacterized protein YqkB